MQQLSKGELYNLKSERNSWAYSPTTSERYELEILATNIKILVSRKESFRLECAGVLPDIRISVKLPNINQ